MDFVRKRNGKAIFSNYHYILEADVRIRLTVHIKAIKKTLSLVGADCTRAVNCCGVRSLAYDIFVFIEYEIIADFRAAVILRISGVIAKHELEK